MKFGRFSLFPPKAEPSREPRVRKAPATDKLSPTVDERTVDAAIQLLENSAFIRVVERLRAQYFSDFATSEPGMGSIQKREAAHYSLVAVDKIVSDIQAIADEKKLHKKQDDGGDF